MTDPATLELLERPPSGKAVVRMTPKGHPLVDLDTAETAPSPGATSRRGLLGALGAAGLAGAAALAISRPASAAPVSPTDADKQLLDAAMRLELTARDLYLEGLGAGIVGDDAALVQVMADNHAAYAEAIAGASGFSARGRDEELFDELQVDFAISDIERFSEAAWTLENDLAATHTELMGEYESIDARTLTASIVVVEGRMGVVFADLGGFSGNVERLLDPPARPITPSSGGDA